VRFHKTDGKERGAISVIFAILISSSLILALLAIVVDVGVIYQERRTLQNSADATALAVAQECAEINNTNPTPTTLCQSGDLSPASTFAGRNSDDGKTRVAIVCGKGSASLQECPPSTGGQFDCKDSSLAGVEQYVRVRTETLSRNDVGTLKFFFAPFLENSNDSFSLKACAQVAWGAASEAPVVFPLALPICFYADAAEKQHNAYDENSKYYEPSENCPYTPVGSTVPIQIDVQVLKGMAMFTAINGSDSGCPTVFDPVIIKIGDFLTPIAPGNANVIASICEPAVRNLGYTGTINTAYEDYLKDFVLGKTLYVPVINELYNGDGKKLKVGYFFSVIVKGLKLKNVIEVGHGESGPASQVTKTGWKSTDCTSNTYCFYGKFTRTTPPGPPKKLDPNQPNTGVNKIVLLP
jgi:Flp pilus assembly protein TadG